MQKLINSIGSVLVEKNGAILLDKGYGYRDAASKTITMKRPFPTGLFHYQTIYFRRHLKTAGRKKISVSDKLSKIFSPATRKEIVLLLSSY